MVKISFIIPVYNSEDTVEHSIRSIISCPLEELEVIVIDDGSTDGSLEICRRVAETDPRVIVYHKENEGLSLTRNAGIDRAKGKYLFFLDSDDRALMLGIDILYRKAEQLEAEGNACDIIQGFYYRVQDGNKELVGAGFPNGWISRNGTAEEVSLYNKIKTESAFGYTTNKLYRKEFLDRHNIRFYPHVRMEDQIFSTQAWSHNPRYYIENQPLFEYWLRSQSLSQGSIPLIAENSTKILTICQDYLKENNTLDENMDIMVPLAMRLLCWSMVRNIPYEGNRLNLIHSKTRTFLESDAFMLIISDRKHRKELRKLPSLLQRLFFGFCFTCVKWNGGRFLSIIMKLGSPVFCSYIAGSVK